ncbi:hypothetical protein RND71_018602 [Anisodus tanguticus]|uniref:Aluminum-activated malate transporter n=1 Tax=Anisodus tanguticus TaxID=243964 RepID=A0AAE1S4L4_9SOLA|nr:hypothetical protein RND71_018602 [Anisodus tanguticus]
MQLPPKANFQHEYFSDEEQQKASENSSDLEDPIYNGYKTVLDSKSFDETLALYASWEPRHSRHCYRFPWQQYVKLGNVLRHFGYTIVALHGCLQTEIQTDTSALLEWKSKLVGRENSKENFERKSLRPTLSKIAITSLEFSEALPFASLLVEIVARLDLVIEEVEELGRIAHFKEYNQDDDHVVNFDEKHSMPMQNELPTHAGD